MNESIKMPKADKDLVRKDHCGFDCCSTSCMVTLPFKSLDQAKRTFRRRKDHQRNFPPG